MANLSKDWTLARILGILRITANEIAPDNLQDPELVDILHLSICDIAELLGKSTFRDYGKRIKIWFQASSPTKENDNDIWINTTTPGAYVQKFWDPTITQPAWVANPNAASIVANIIDLSNHRVGSIIKLTDDVLAATVNGLCVEVNQKEFEGLYNIPQKQSNIFYTRFGERLYIYDGTNLVARGASYALHLFYNRVPLKVTLGSDTIDLRDKYTKLVIDKAKIMVYETLKEVPPESLTNVVNNSVNLIRQSNLAEFGLVKNKVNKNDNSKDRRVK